MMKIKFCLPFLYILFYSLSNSLLAETKKLKVGLLAPFSGEYKDVGNSLILSTQLALKDIGKDDVIVVPKDSGSNDENKLKSAIKEIVDENINIVLGPLTHNELKQAKKHKNIVFISPSNFDNQIQDNILSIGINLESQLIAIKKFLEKEKKNNTIILYPNDKNANYLKSSVRNIFKKEYKLYKYSSDPQILTGEIEKITNYSQRKRNLESRKKFLENKEDDRSKKELKKLEEKYTLGKVNFDSVLILDFGNRLNSVISSLLFSDVSENDVMYITLNQWFDNAIFRESALKILYYPSVNYKNFIGFRKKFQLNFKRRPTDISILTYDSIGLVYYIWKKKGKINNIRDFVMKEKIKGKIGNFYFSDNKIFQELEIYKTKKSNLKEF